MEKCANCERVIGNLETPMLFQEKIVCADCHGRLAGGSQISNLKSQNKSMEQVAAELADEREPVTSGWNPKSSMARHYAPSPPTQKSSGLAVFGLALCMIGPVVGTIGYGMFEQTNSRGWAALAGVGILACLIGLLCYAAYRMGKDV